MLHCLAFFCFRDYLQAEGTLCQTSPGSSQILLGEVNTSQLLPPELAAYIIAWVSATFSACFMKEAVS